jgi:beta-galactosidase/beta-glucuronidase
MAPYLYAVRLALLSQSEVIDEWWFETGFRKIEMIDRQFWLNGESFVVRGVNWIEDYGNGSTLLDRRKRCNCSRR